MAYGNWGAWVFRNDEHMPQWEDQSPYDEEGLLAGYHQAFGRGGKFGLHHAVLGGRELRLCGYKHVPVLLFRMEPVDLSSFRTDDGQAKWDDHIYEGEINGYRFRAEQFDGNMLDLWLSEPDGTRWSARCGYCFGAGHDDVPWSLPWLLAAASPVEQEGDPT